MLLYNHNILFWGVIMKKTTRLICLLAALALMFACFAGCGEEEVSSAIDTTSSDTGSATNTEIIDQTNNNDLPDYDLGGVTLTVASGHESVLFPDEEKNELESRRKKWIDDCKTQYNFELTHTYYAWNQLTTTLLPDIISGDYVADFVLPVIRQAGPFVQARLCYDLASKDFSEYLDFSKPWWDTTMLKASTIAGKTYCCTPQFTSAANTTWVCFFNRTLMEELEVDPDSLYEMQEKGTWTWDKFIELGKKAVKDIDANGTMDMNDRFAFGTARWHAFNNLLTAAEVDFLVEKDGKFQYTLNNSHAITVLTKMNEMFTGYGMYFDVENGGRGLYDMFANDQLLFALTAVATCSNETIRDMESDFGMVLTPKYSEDQEYISRAEQTTVCCFVPVTAQYKLETAFALQALSYNAWKIGVPDIMELNFAQYVRDDGSEHCIYEVFNHTTFTVDQLLFDVGIEKKWVDIILPNVMMPVVTQAGADMSGAVQTVATQCQTLLDDFYGQATGQK